MPTILLKQLILGSVPGFKFQVTNRDKKIKKNAIVINLLIVKLTNNSTSLSCRVWPSFHNDVAGLGLLTQAPGECSRPGPLA